MDTDEKLKELSKQHLITNINWTRNDLRKAGMHKDLNYYVRSCCRMVLEAV